MKVEGVGPNGAKICIVGEAPGEQEEKKGIPFVGAAGKVLDDILEEVGIKRDECYITNLYKERPKSNDLSTVDRAELQRAFADLQAEITAVRPNVIVALGHYPLEYLTGYKSISDWRGSVIETSLGKVIPTYHPAGILREWTFRPISVVDWVKVKKESADAGIKTVARDIVIRPSFDDVTTFLRAIVSNRTKVAFDIEVETRQINCIAFATAPVHAMCIPFWFGASGSFWSEEQELEIWQLIKQVLEDSNVPKIAQNAQYDMTILRDLYGITVNGLGLDTMVAFHSIYPELPKGLDLLCSLYTDVSFYKYQRMTKDMDTFFRYNAMDAAVTFECAEKIAKEMEEFGITKFYYEHMHSLIVPLMDIGGKGVRIDSELRKKVTKELKIQEVELQDKLEKLVGHPLNVNSPKQMKGWLYDELKLKPKFKLRKDKGEKTLAADEEALDSLYRETHLEELRLVLGIRECRKLTSTYLEVEYDKENGVERARTSYLITGTETGRLSSRETVYGTGTNMQNIPKGSIRRMFVPDDGKTFVNADLSQAEARVVAWLAGENRLMQVFTNGGDIHRRNAANIFRKAEKDVTKDERELAKRIVHASNYGMGPITFAKNAGVSVAEAKKLLNAYFSEYPRIKLWHMSIENTLRKTRTLTTPLGRKRTFFNRWDSTLLREAYAYIPQSTVADVLNVGLRRCYAEYRNTDTNILLQIHDAVLLQTPTPGVANVARRVKELLTIPIQIGIQQLVIPVDVSIGPNWGELEKA